MNLRDLRVISAEPLLVPPANMHPTEFFTRRRFLTRGSLAAAALSAAPSLTGAQPVRSANSRISIGMIGTGSRGSALMREALALAPKHNIAITAVCDVWKKNREGAFAAVTGSGGTAPQQFTRYEELLTRKDNDAVVIATPDFSHGRILLAALQAGKDVYIEKPMTIDIESADKALQLARATGRVVQTGTQRRSNGHFIKAAKLIASGELGHLSRVSAAMNVNAARWMRRVDDCRREDVDWDAFTLGKLAPAFDARLLRCWQLYRATSNGLPGLWMTHYADAVHLLTGAKYPQSVVTLGGNYVWHDGREHADTMHTVLEYPEGFLFNWSMGLGNAAGVHFTLHGTKATLDAERWTLTAENSKELPAKIAAERNGSHLENWLECLRSRARPNADIEVGFQHVVATVMAATALETGRRQKWDAARREMVSA